MDFSLNKEKKMSSRSEVRTQIAHLEKAGTTEFDGREFCWLLTSFVEAGLIPSDFGYTEDYLESLHLRFVDSLSDEALRMHIFNMSTLLAKKSGTPPQDPLLWMMWLLDPERTFPLE